MTSNLDHMEFWVQLEARIRARRMKLQEWIDANGSSDAALRHMIGERAGLRFVQTAAREVYAEMTGTTPAGPDHEPQDDFPV